MVRARSFRVGAALCATGALLGGASSSLAAIRGSYNGFGKGFMVAFDVTRAHVDDLIVGCGQGAITVEAVGVAPKVKNASFTYSGPAHSSNRTKSFHMKVTGTFFDKGKKVKGMASTAGVCKTGTYSASKWPTA